MIGVVSLDELADGSPDAIAALRDALHGDGVVALDAAGRFGGGSTTELFEQARRFFLLPLAERRAVGLSSSTNLRGFVGVGQETTNGVVDLKESFEFARELSPPAGDPSPWHRLYGSNLWPDTDVLPGFRSVLRRFVDDIGAIGDSVVRSLVSSLGQPLGPGAPSGFFDRESCVFSRLIRYGDPGEHRDDATRLDAHTDHGLVTLTLEDSPGLEVQRRDGGWEIAEGVPLVFAGELLEFWSLGYFRACPHRVMSGALIRERLSIATFIEPDLGAVVAPVRRSSFDSSEAPGVPVGNFWLPDDQVPGDDPPPVAVGDAEWRRMASIFGDEVAS